MLQHIGAATLVFISLIGIGVTFAHADTSVCPYVWQRSLRSGASGADVHALQRFLNTDPATQLALAGAGSPGNETASYGPLTAAAVSKFQKIYADDILVPAGLQNPTGIVLALTRAKLNTLCATTSAATVQPAAVNADVLTVSGALQPSQTIVPAGAGGVPFTTFTLTAGDEAVTVESVTVQRVGPGEDGAFSDVALNDDTGQIGDTETLTSDHLATFSEPFTVPANTSETITVTGDMAGDLSDFGGEMPALQVDAIQASSPVQGSLPIEGTAQTLNASLVIGNASLSLSSFDPDGATTHYINDTGVIFSGIRMTAASQEDLTLTSISFDQNGSAGPDDLANVAIVVNGSSTPTTLSGRMYTASFSPGIDIPKGQSVDVYIQGDVTTSGANRTVEFDIDKSSEIGLTGNTFGFWVGATPGDDTATTGNSVFLTDDGTPDGNPLTPFFAGSMMTIDPGTLISIHS